MSRRLRLALPAALGLRVSSVWAVVAALPLAALRGVRLLAAWQAALHVAQA